MLGPRDPARVRLEALLTSPQAFGLASATPLQRALCRASDGEPLGELWEHQEVRDAFGGERPPEVAPDWFCILSAIRCGKSLFAAAKAVQISQNVDLSHPWISVGDEIRIPIVSVRMEEAMAVYNHLVRNLLARPALRQLLIGEPTANSVMLRHPSGRPIEVTIAPLSKAGAALVARWLPCVIFDEAPLMAGQQDGKKNLDEALAAISGRVLPGGQVMLIGSPWAPFGPIYDLVQEHFGKPSPATVVARAPGPAMNPIYWTPERCERMRRTNPSAHRTNVLALFADLEEALFSSIEVEEAQRVSMVRPYEPGHHYVAAMDPATRGNAWTLLIIECTGVGGPSGFDPMYAIALAVQWQGSKTAPLKPDAVIQEIAAHLRHYRLDSVVSDQHSVDAIRAIADRHNLRIVERTIRADNRLEMVERARVVLAEGRLEIPPDRQLVSDILSAKKRVTSNGVTLVLPRSGDGRHADYVPPLGLAFEFPPDLPDPPDLPERDDLERIKADMDARAAEPFQDNAALRVSGYR